MDTQGRLLLAAAQFIRSEGEGLMTELMAEACEDAARKLEKNGAKPALVMTPPPVTNPQIPTVVENGISDENVKILLRAGGYKYAKKPTVILYGFMLRNSTRDWSPTEVAKKIRGNPHAVSQSLWALAKANIIKRTQVGRYQAS